MEGPGADDRDRLARIEVGQRLSVDGKDNDLLDGVVRLAVKVVMISTPSVWMRTGNTHWPVTTRPS
jgi:hypothetical protein